MIEKLDSDFAINALFSFRYSYFALMPAWKVKKNSTNASTIWHQMSGRISLKMMPMKLPISTAGIMTEARP